MSTWREGDSRRKPKRTTRPAATPAKSEEPAPESKDWRKKSLANVARGKQAKRVWSDQETDPTMIYRAWHRFKTALAIFALIAILVSIYLVLRPKKKTHLVFVSPQLNTTTRVWQTNSGLTGKPFNHDFFANKRRLFLHHDENDILISPDSTDDWNRFLRDVKLGGPLKDTLIYYFSATGVVDEQGAPYLLNNHSPRPLSDGSAWVTVESLFDALIEHTPKYDDSIPARIIVLIDSNRMEPVVSPAMMYDRFPTALQKLYEEKQYQDKKLYVCCSHQSGQRSWLAHELGGSIFTCFAAFGVQGHADGFADSDPDNRVTLSEWRNYLKTKVAQYAQESRDVPQQPLCLPTRLEPEDDFEIAIANVKTQEEVNRTWTLNTNSVQEFLGNRTTEINQAWADYYNANAAGVWEDRPFEKANVEAKLIRLEQLFVTDNTTEFNDVRGSIFIPRPHRDPLHPPLTIAEARMVNDPVAVGEHKTTWDDYARHQQTLKTADDSDAGKDARSKAEVELDSIRSSLVVLKNWEMHQAVWEQLLEVPGGPSLEDLERAETFFVFELPSRSTVMPVESQFLQVLMEAVDWEDQANMAMIRQTVGLAINCRDQSERAVLAIGRIPHAMRWVESDFNQLESRRRLAEDRLRANEYELAKSEFESLVGADGQSAYDQLTQRATQMAQAVDVHQEAIHAIPYLAAWEFRRSLVRGDERLKGSVENIEAFLNMTLRLGDALNSDDAGDIVQLSEQISAALTQIKNGFQSAVSQFLRDSETLTNSVDIQIALMCPLLRRDDREQLRSKLVKALVTLEPDPDHIFSQKVSTGRDLNTIDPNAFAAYTASIKDAYVKHFNDSSREQLFQQWLSQTASMDWRESDYDTIDAINERIGMIKGDPVEDRINKAYNFMSQIRALMPYICEQGLTEEITKPHFNNFTFQSLGDVYRDARQMRRWLWLADRARKDFWGPKESPYWAATCGRYLSRVRQYENNLPELTVAESQMDSLLKGWQRVTLVGPQRAERDGSNYALQAQIIANEGLELPDDMGIARISIYDRRQEDQVIESWPDQQNDPQTLRRHPLSLDGLRDMLDVGLKFQSNGSSQWRPRMELDYRGHRYVVSYSVPPQVTAAGEAPPLVSNLDVRPLGPPEITVHGEGKGTTDIVFIIDCSDSMKKEFDADEGGKRDRMTAAKEAAQSILDQMKGSRNYRVALMIIGGTVGVEYNRVTRSSHYIYRDITSGERSRKIIEGQPTHTANDYLFLHRIDPAKDTSTIRDDYAPMIRAIERISYLGYTPLYRGIAEAAKHLDDVKIDSDVPQQIVIFSDGLNLTRDHKDEPRDRSLQDLLNTRLLDNKTVNMIYFAEKNEGNANEVAKWQELQQVIDRSEDGPAPKLVTNLREVSDYLETIITVYRYQVTGVGVPNIDGGWKELGERWAPQQQEFVPGDYEVKVDRISQPFPLRLYGGEKVDLDLLNNRLSLREETAPFRDQQLIRLAAVKPPPNRELRIGRNPSDPNYPTVSFEFPVANQSGGLVIPPERACLEVIPDGAGERVVVQDFQLKYLGHLPTIEFASIPQQSNSRLVLHLAADDVDNGQRYSIWSEGTTTHTDSNDKEYLIRSEVNGTIVKITISPGERNTPTADDVKNLLVHYPKIKLMAESNPHKNFQVVRRFSSNGVAEHEFDLGGIDSGEIDESFYIQELNDGNLFPRNQVLQFEYKGS